MSVAQQVGVCPECGQQGVIHDWGTRPVCGNCIEKWARQASAPRKCKCGGRDPFCPYCDGKGVTK